MNFLVLILFRVPLPPERKKSGSCNLLLICVVEPRLAWALLEESSLEHSVLEESAFGQSTLRLHPMKEPATSTSIESTVPAALQLSYIRVSG